MSDPASVKDNSSDCEISLKLHSNGESPQKNTSAYNDKTLCASKIVTTDITKRLLKSKTIRLQR